MAIPITPATASRPPASNIRPTQGTVVTLTTNQTNTATVATQITGLTDTFTIQPLTRHLMICLQADSITNSGANNVIMTVWNGVVGTGTQISQFTNAAQSSAASAVSQIAYLAIAPALWGTNITLNVGMHGSGAGTNTLAASATAPCNFWVFAF